MKNLVKALSVVVLGAGLASFGSAQSAGPVGGSVKSQHKAGSGHKAKMRKERKRILDQLDLTADQTKQINKLAMDRKMSFEKLQKDSNQHPDRAKMGEIAKTYHAGLMKVLTTEQKAKYKQLVAEKRKERAAKKDAAKDSAAKAGSTPTSKP